MKLYIYIYIKIYSAVVFGIRKQLQAEHGRQEREEKIREFEIKKLKLHNRIIELNKTIREKQERYKEKKAIEETNREAEIQYLKKLQEILNKILG